MDVEVEAKVVTSRVASHLCLLRTEGFPGYRDFCSKMKTILTNHPGLPGTKGTLGMGDFCCYSWESNPG